MQTIIILSCFQTRAVLSFWLGPVSLLDGPVLLRLMWTQKQKNPKKQTKKNLRGDEIRANNKKNIFLIVFFFFSPFNETTQMEDFCFYFPSSLEHKHLAVKPLAVVEAGQVERAS